jgi:hypothetical protein
MRTHDPSTIRWSLPLSVAALIAVLVACGNPQVPPVTDPPAIQSFTATPDAITTCESSTLAWSVTGSGVTVAIAANGSTLLTTDERDGDLVVTPTATTTYTLTATNAGGPVSDTVTVTVTSHAGGTPSLTNLTAATVRGSQVDLAWDVANAGCIEVSAAASSAADAPSTPIVTLEGGDSGRTVPIPASDRQTIRVCAVSGDQRDCATTGLTNVVTSSADYDPYFLEPDLDEPDRDVPWPEPPIPGTLRDVIANAAPGAIIGFAADIDEIQIRGVDLLFVDGFGYFDAHFIFTDDVTISGPPGGVALEGVTAWLPGNPPGDPFTYRSRMMMVAQGVDVTLEHLTITGGTFIYKGGGIRNDGTLTIRDSAVVGNRAWEHGGGIYNAATGVLTVERTTIADNQALTTEAELESGEYFIRRAEPDGFRIEMADTGQGGGLYLDAGSVTTLIDSLVQGNDATEGGGGIYHRYTVGQQNTSLILTNTTYGTNNTPQNYLGEQVAVNGSSVSPASTAGPDGGQRTR